MKYPQLVSTRAVSAISDWLVTQLEQLGVDASLVYSRLLLSLLHTPLQINALDLAEISEIKVGTLVRSKINVGSGNNYRRFSAADTEALKRLAAIDSLLEAVSSDQKLSKIETLIDELSEKLREIERQNHADDSISNGFVYVNNDDVELNSANKDSSVSDDPAKRYYRAFPALSTQLADDNRVAIKSCVSWPRAAPKSNDERRGTVDAKIDEFSLNHCNNIAEAGAVAEPKRKPKRKRGSVMSSTSSKSNNASVNESGRNRFNSQPQSQQQLHQNKHFRKKSPTSWDTEFDGAWEMGRDLIREFIMKQNNRNRTCSESEANKFVKMSTVVRDVDDAINAYELEQNDDAEMGLIKMATAVTSTIVGKQYMPGSSNTTDSGSYSSAATLSSDMNVRPFIDDGKAMVFGSDECTTPETLSSLNEADCNSQRRLYEREVSLESINRIVDNCVGPNEDCVDAGCDETKYLAAFEAKFNRNVEALWNNAENDETPAAMSLPPSNSTQSFWHNYYKHHYNASDGRVFDVFSAQVAQPTQPPQSLPPTMTATSGALGLTCSIWTDNAMNNEDDVSFYANAKLWEKDYCSKVEQPFNDDYQNADRNTMGCSGSDFTFNKNDAQLPASTMMMMMMGDNRQMHAFDDATMFKWSDNATEKPFMPLTLPADLPEMQNEEKIRRNLFENSYFDESGSAPSVIDFNAKCEPLHSNVGVNISSMQFCEQQPSTPVIVNRVTLANHSSSSGFKEVQPKQAADIAASIPQINAKQYQSQPSIDGENLLTSERTHFRPIKQTYPDGYSFDISDELDEICYERSASGTMYLDSEIYREYYVYDDEGNGGSRFQLDDASDGTPSSVPFILKYCVKQNEKSSQTDVIVPTPPPQQQQHQIASNLSMHQLKKLTQYRVTQTSEMPNRCIVDNNQLSEIVSADEYLNMQGWTLAENRKKCNNNNNAHALWEHCAACSNDVVISMPANRLLKDELSADGDEIMTDLKYMRNLYIGSDWEDDDESDAMADDDVDDDDGLMLPLEAKMKCVDKKDSQSGVAAMTDNDDDGYSDTQTNHIYYNVSKLISDLLQPEKARTLVQAISEKCTGNNSNGSASNLSNLGRLANNKNGTAAAVDVGNSCGGDSFFGGLWDNNDNSIWRKEPPNKTSSNCAANSIWSTTIEYDANMNSIEYGMANKNYEHLKMAYANTNQWEHANLEKIWTTAQNTSDLSNQHRKRIKETNESTAATATLLSLLNDSAHIHHISHHEKCFSHTHHAKSRYDRKRRHSATSQNVFEHQLNSCGFANCDAADRHKKQSATNIITCRYWTTDTSCFRPGIMDTTTDNDYANENNNNTNNRNLNHHLEFQQQQCFLPFVNQYQTAGINVPLHPTSILKHVAAMVARPLTR